MISITDFNDFCTELVNANLGLKGFHRVVDDKHAVNKLKDKTGIQMVAVVPSAERSGTPTANVDNNTALMFIISKEPPSQNDAKELASYQATQDVAAAIRDYVLTNQEDGCSIFFRLQPSSIHIDTEYNIFGGWNGWSLQFIF